MTDERRLSAHLTRQSRSWLDAPHWSGCFSRVGGSTSKAMPGGSLSDIAFHEMTVERRAFRGPLIPACVFGRMGALDASFPLLLRIGAFSTDRLYAYPTQYFSSLGLLRSNPSNPSNAPSQAGELGLHLDGLLDAWTRGRVAVLVQAVGKSAPAPARAYGARPRPLGLWTVALGQRERCLRRDK